MRSLHPLRDREPDRRGCLLQAIRIPPSQRTALRSMSAQPSPVPGYPPGYDELGKSTIPAGLELAQIHIYFRHGERTPVRQRLTHLGIPSQWNLCTAGREFAVGVLNDPDARIGSDAGSSAAASQTSTSSSSTSEVPGQGRRQQHRSQLMLLKRKMEFGRGNDSRIGGDAECAWGELTDLGRSSTLRLGKQLRELYVNKQVAGWNEHYSWANRTDIRRARLLTLNFVGQTRLSARTDIGARRGYPCSAIDRAPTGLRKPAASCQ